VHDNNRFKTFYRRPGNPDPPTVDHELHLFSRDTDEKLRTIDHAGVVRIVGYEGESVGGIQFDTYPQAGQYLYVETEGSATSPSGYGQEFYDHSGNGINLGVSNGGNLDLRVIGGGHLSLDSTGGIQITETNSSGFGNITINSAYGQMYLLAHDDLDLESAEWGFLHFRSTGLLAKTGHRIDVEAETVASFRALHGSVGIEADGASDSSITLGANGFWRHSIFGNPDSFMDDKPGHLFLLNTGGDGSRTEINDLGAAGGAILRIDVASDGTVTYHMKAGGAWIADL
jgi:hypothetical protein